MSDERIPEVRRVLYSIVFLTGVRIGELAELRWSDLVEREPLSALRINRAWNTKAMKVKQKPKTDVGREAPVHPVLMELLQHWKEIGWAAEFRRAPKPSDLLVPYPKSWGKGRRVGGPEFHWRGDRVRKLLLVDCATLGMRKRTTHDGRATFITMAEEDGCGPLIHHVTHTPPKNIRAGYIRRPPVGTPLRGGLEAADPAVTA